MMLNEVKSRCRSQQKPRIIMGCREARLQVLTVVRNQSTALAGAPVAKLDRQAFIDDLAAAEFDGCDEWDDDAGHGELVLRARIYAPITGVEEIQNIAINASAPEYRYRRATTFRGRRCSILVRLPDSRGKNAAFVRLP